MLGGPRIRRAQQAEAPKSYCGNWIHCARSHRAPGICVPVPSRLNVGVQALFSASPSAFPLGWTSGNRGSVWFHGQFPLADTSIVGIYTGSVGHLQSFGVPEHSKSVGQPLSVRSGTAV